MIITYYGASCFKIQSGEIVLGLDPPSKESGLKAPRFESHVALISHNHPKHNGREALNAKGEKLLIIDGPGEYEIKGAFINGISSFHDSEHGKKYGLNTIYNIEREGMTLAHFGDFGEKDLRSDIKERLNGIDILLLPIGGDTVMSAEVAAQIVNQIEPRVVIPMHFDSPAKSKSGKTKSSIEIFLEELGQEKIKPEEKFTIKKKELAEEGVKVVILQPII